MLVQKQKEECLSCGRLYRKLSRKCYVCKTQTCGRAFCGVEIYESGNVVFMSPEWICRSCITENSVRSMFEEMAEEEGQALSE